ncbi:thioredoxin reductase (NADPH) [Tistlia consotensis]|uniref:Ferredoxin--NADP reductase n=1 Tax=Tistlia consotensis USBA 355 TaxID=560819 RepID=A0A1Y6BCS3_9PROT|nr:NAD(P)/FAD-dependent oxidoreductase [Tistlia consotensis]SME94111.1 thioredoxin reductase (NADPH) [Tistlia consotensis USBA 355]SNR29063.1 thioredoxin reductase (NADPH) [Tistlia consotensis]
MTETPPRTDVAVIGAGPVGLFAVFECGMLQLRCHVFDALDAAGGQCTALYPEKPIYDIPGYPKIQAAELVERLFEQAAPFEPAYHLGERVERLEACSLDGADGWRLTSSKGTVVEARAVIVAAGVGAFGPNRPPLAGIEAYEGRGEGRGVHYFVTRPEGFRGKRVVIAGGGDSALDWAIILAELADRLYVVHRRERFRGAPESVARLHALAEAGRIELVVPFQLDSLQGRDGALEAVVVRDLDGGQRTLEADVLLPFFGLSMNLGPIAEWGLNLDHHLIVADPASGATDKPGIYAIGDIATYPNKLKLILCGFSEAAMAAHAIRRRLHPDEELHWEYSTTRGVPGG